MQKLKIKIGILSLVLITGMAIAQKNVQSLKSSQITATASATAADVKEYKYESVKGDLLNLHTRQWIKSVFKCV
jgi:hypothetical protein